MHKHAVSPSRPAPALAQGVDLQLVVMRPELREPRQPLQVPQLREEVAREVEPDELAVEGREGAIRDALYACVCLQSLKEGDVRGLWYIKASHVDTTQRLIMQLQSASCGWTHEGKAACSMAMRSASPPS